MSEIILLIPLRSVQILPPDLPVCLPWRDRSPNQPEENACQLQSDSYKIISSLFRGRTLTLFFHFKFRKALIDVWCSPCLGVGSPTMYGGGMFDWMISREELCVVRNCWVEILIMASLLGLFYVFLLLPSLSYLHVSIIRDIVELVLHSGTTATCSRTDESRADGSERCHSLERH